MVKTGNTGGLTEDMIDFFNVNKEAKENLEQYANVVNQIDERTNQNDRMNDVSEEKDVSSEIQDVGHDEHEEFLNELMKKKKGPNVDFH